MLVIMGCASMHLAILLSHAAVAPSVQLQPQVADACNTECFAEGEKHGTTKAQLLDGHIQNCVYLLHHDIAELCMHAYAYAWTVWPVTHKSQSISVAHNASQTAKLLAELYHRTQAGGHMAATIHNLLQQLLHGLYTLSCKVSMQGRSTLHA